MKFDENLVLSDFYCNFTPLRSVHVPKFFKRLAFENPVFSKSHLQKFWSKKNLKKNQKVSSKITTI
jgi:hypothetical protein